MDVLPLATTLRQYVLSHDKLSNIKYDESYAMSYHAYDAHLSQVMTVAALLVGFIITGTLLRVSSEGEENVSREEQYLFGKAGVQCTMLSVLSLLIAFAVSARVVSVFAERGSKHALLAMYNQFLGLAVAEQFLFYSLLFFIIDLRTFIAMVFRGPDICVGLQPVVAPSFEHPTNFRPLAFCGQLGDDLFITANATCGGDRTLNHSGNLDVDALEKLQMRQDASWTNRSPDAEHYVMCSVFDWYVAKQRATFGEVRSQYYAYESLFMPPGVRGEEGTRGQLKWVWKMLVRVTNCLRPGGRLVRKPFTTAYNKLHTDEITKIYCQKKEAFSLRDELCSAHLTPAHRVSAAEERMACAASRSAFIKGKQCARDVSLDVIRCHQICNRDMRLWGKIDLHSNVYCVFLFLGLVIISAMRFIGHLVHFFSVRARYRQILKLDQEEEQQEMEPEEPRSDMSNVAMSFD